MRIRGCAYIEDMGKVLVLIYDYPGGRVCALPGGGVHDGETVADAVVRECREELGIEIKLGGLRLVGDMLPQGGSTKQTLHLVFDASILQGEPKLNASETTAHEVTWLDLPQLAEVSLYPAVNQALLEDRAGTAGARYLGNCMKRDWV